MGVADLGRSAEEKRWGVCHLMDDKLGWNVCHPLDDKPVSTTGKILTALPVRQRQPLPHEKVKTRHLRPQEDRLLDRRRGPLPTTGAASSVGAAATRQSQ